MITPTMSINDSKYIKHEFKSQKTTKLPSKVREAIFIKINQISHEKEVSLPRKPKFCGFLTFKRGFSNLVSLLHMISV